MAIMPETNFDERTPDILHQRKRVSDKGWTDTIGIKEKMMSSLDISTSSGLPDTGCFFFTGPPPKKLKYGKPRLGKVRCI